MDDSFKDLREASCQNQDCTVFYQTNEHEVAVDRLFYDRYVYESWSYTCSACGQVSTFDRKFDVDRLRN